MNHDADNAIAALRLLDNAFEPCNHAKAIVADTIRKMDRELNRLQFIEAQFEAAQRKLTALRTTIEQQKNTVPRGTFCESVEKFFSRWEKQSPFNNR